MIKVLLPSFVGYWIFMVALASGAWYLWTRVYKTLAFRWQAPVIVGTAATLYLAASTLVGFYQNDAVIAYERGRAPGDPAVAQPTSLVESSPQEMKAAFLKEAESLVANPDQITAENKQKLFDQFAPLFVSKAEKDTYAQNIGAVYDCQKAFWQDALTSFKSKKEVKSDLRKECESKSGAFFSRPKLVPEESAAQNDETIVNLAGHKRVPASDGKMVEVNEAMIRKALAAQERASASVTRIFE